MALVLDKTGITVVLNRLARNPNGRAADLYAKLMSSWGARPDRRWLTIKVSEQDWSLLQGLKLPEFIWGNAVLQSKWLVTYRHPQNKQLEVTVRSKSKPPKKKTFNIGGKKRRLVAVQVTRLNKEAVPVAKAKTRSKKAVEDDDLDELEGLEDLDDLDELDEDEPVDEADVDEEDEDEEEEPAPKRSKRGKASTKSKGSTAKKGRSRKAAAVEEDEEDDEEEPAPRKRSSTKSKTKAKSNGSSGSNLPAARELPKGQVGPQQIADMVGGGCDARYVRVWLRDSDYERDEGSRWAFSKSDGRDIARQIKRDRKSRGE